MGKVSKALDKAYHVNASPAGDQQKLEKMRGHSGPQTRAEKPEDKPVLKSRQPSSAAWDERLSQATTVTGPVAESFRTLRTRILHPDTGKIPRSLLITSATPGEGKSFVCANLGVVLAQGVDQYCLMVDCDLRKPALHRFFGLSLGRGLVNYLRDNEDLASMIVPAGVETLSLLSAGPPPVNPAELLGSERLARLVDELENRYDDRIILLDSPPLQAASETAILAQHVDGVILVVRWGGSRREHVRKLVERIGRERIIGVVFNAYEENVLAAKAFGYYEYQDNYSYREE
ncbi:MAG TPA: polysaccharide biosynthesis tyrosine autokinase [Desulfobulbaceae bacterium]|nr:polysaccharide biosynthesis tyrosine autokinase [Desulfobulbaceae bacterium]